MSVELNITSSNQDILKYLRDVKTHLVGIDDAFEKVDKTGKVAFGGAEKTTRKYNDEVKRTNGLIEDVEDAIKGWEDKARKATNIADLQKYNRKIAEAKQNLNEYKKEGVKSLRAVNKEAKTSTGLFSNLNKTIKTAFTAAVFSRVIGDLTDTALSLDLLEKKATSVFGKYADDVKKVGKETAASLGLTEAEFLKATSGAGDVMKQLQLTNKEAAVMSTGLVTLSGALAEWSSGQYTASETSKILTKAFLGEYESLKSLDIAIRDSDITAKLVGKNQNKLTGAKLAQAKALATLELLYERTTARQDAFKNNSGSLTREYSEMNAKFKSVRDTLSTDLIPTFNRMFGFVNDNFEAIKTLAKWLGIGAAAILGYKAGVMVANGVMRVYTIVTNLATIATRTFDTTTKTSLVGAFAGLLTTAVAAFVMFRGEADEATDSLSNMNEELDNVNKNLGQNIYSNLVFGWNQATKTFAGSIDNLREKINGLTKTELESMKLYIEDTIASTKKMGSESTELARKIQDVDLKNLEDSLGLINTELTKFGKPADNAIIKYDELKKEIKKLEDQLKNEIAANDLNYLSTGRLLYAKKRELQAIEDINDALLKSVEIRKLVTRKMDFHDTDKGNAFFDTDYEYAVNIDEGKLKDELYKGMMKVLAARRVAAKNAAKDFESEQDDGDFSFWKLVGLNPNNPDDQKMIAAAQDYVNQMIGIISQMVDAERQAADERVALKNTLIAEKQREIEAEIELNKQGYASNIQQKQQEQEALKKERQKALEDQEKAKKEQLMIESVMQLSSLITSSANIFKVFSAIPYIGIPLAIAMIGTMIGAFIASKAKAAKLTKLRHGRTGLIRGRSHAEGGEQFEVEGGEYHSITPKSKAKKHLPLLESIRKDDKLGMAKALYNLLDGYEISRDLPRQLQEKQEKLRLSQTIRVENSGISETNRLLGAMLGKSGTPAIDTSDPNYIKYIFNEHYEKWVRR